MSESGIPRTPRPANEQRRVSLTEANEVRRFHAQLKRELASGRRRIDELVLDPPALARSARVWQLLLALPGVGPARVSRTLNACRIATGKTLGGLTDRQRAELASHAAQLIRHKPRH